MSVLKNAPGVLAGTALAYLLCARVDAQPAADDPPAGDATTAATPNMPPATGSGAGLPTLDDQQAASIVGAETITVHDNYLPTASLLHADPSAASDYSINQQQLALRPRYRTEDVVAEVPGLFAVQHAGGGKSDQYFLRGFDLDHGTDAAFFVDGLPINAVSHGHGQGYSDLHFLIPETIGTIESTKGPYSALVGDFATAGSVGFHLLDHVDESYAKIELGPNNHTRVLALDSPDLGDKWRGIVAAEVSDDDGPFIHPDAYQRMNGYAKVTRKFDDGGELSAMAMAYGGTWNMSGVLPARAVCGESDGTPVPAAYAGSHCINRFDSIDPSQGGGSQRFMSLLSYRKPIAHGDVELTAYGLHSNLQLFPNDGIAAAFQPAGIQYGSQVEQDDSRFESGINATVHRTDDVEGTTLHSTYGLQIRNDVIASQLHRTEQRVRLDGMPGIPGPIEDSAIDETEMGAFVEEDWRLRKWLRLVLGGRADRVDADVNNMSPVAAVKPSGYVGQGQLSPKAALVVSPTSQLDLFANFGQGFHSNDVRTLIVGSATTLLAKATGGELGVTLRPMPRLALSGVAFVLDLTSEQTIDGDVASTEPSGPTRRYGTELTARYEGVHMFAQGTYTYAHARYTDAADIAAGTDYVELAPKHTLSAEVGTWQRVGPIAITGSLNVRAMSDRAASSDNTLTATGFAIVSGALSARYKRVEVGLDVINIGDEKWREGQFVVASRLPGEGPNPPEGISFTPGVPRTFLGNLIVRFP